MTGALWKKAIQEGRLLWAGCAVILFIFCWVRVWITSRLDMSRFRNILENLPDSWQRLAPVPIEELFTYEGRIAVSYEEPMVYLMMAVWTIARGSDSVSGAIGRGTMEMMVAQPISRLRLLSTQTAVTLIGAALLALVAYAGTCTGIATTVVELPARPVTIPLLNLPLPFWNRQPESVRMQELVRPLVLLPAALNYACLGMFLTGLTTFLSSWDRYRWRTIGLTVAIYVAQTLLELVGMAVPGWEWVRRLTFFTAYEPIAFVSRSLESPGYAWAFLSRSGETQALELGPLGCNLVLSGLGLAGWIAATIIFCRRDLPAPL
jgi:ABC-2 type transport system permease protein